MHPGRKRAALALTAFATSFAIVNTPASPTQAEPDIDSVQERVDTLYHKAEVAQERFNDAKVKLTKLTRQVRTLEKDQARQEKKVESSRTEVEDSIVSEYKGTGVSAVAQVAVSNDPRQFIEEMTTMSTYNDIQADTFSDYSVQLASLGLREDQVKDRQAEAKRLKASLGKEKKKVDASYAKAKSLLDRLKEEQRAREAAEAASRDDSTAAPAAPAPIADAAPASGRAAAAVAYALAQVGDAYVYGAAGPDAFDCSGLTMMAWAQAGVGLPHSSSAQMGSGTPVSSDALQPGDLVFYYSPVSHVAIYIGNGQIVHAANPGDGVLVAPVFSMPYSGAVRPG